MYGTWQVKDWHGQSKEGKRAGLCWAVWSPFWPPGQFCNSARNGSCRAVAAAQVCQRFTGRHSHVYQGSGSLSSLDNLISSANGLMCQFQPMAQNRARNDVLLIMAIGLGNRRNIRKVEMVEMVFWFHFKTGWWFGIFFYFPNFHPQNNGKIFMRKMMKQNWLVVWLPCFVFPRNIGFMSSSQLTNSIIFQRGSAQKPPTRKGLCQCFATHHYSHQGW